jgi:hypothetical protein
MMAGADDGGSICAQALCCERRLPCLLIPDCALKFFCRTCLLPHVSPPSNALGVSWCVYVCNWKHRYGARCA